MTAPPTYPRTPHLEDDPDQWLGRPVDVEEKLDGANVAIWWEGGRPRVMSRGGPDAMDRASQLGRLRSWAAERSEALDMLCADGTVVYAEWLWLTHGVRYEKLPDLLVVLDLWRPETGFLALASRNEQCRKAGFTVPPLVAEEIVLQDLEQARSLLEVSAFGSEPMEGVVLRDSTGRRAKVVRTGFRQRDDTSWREARIFNTVLA